MERFNYYTCEDNRFIVMDERFNVVLGKTANEQSAINAVNSLNSMSEQKYLEHDLTDLNLFC